MNGISFLGRHKWQVLVVYMLKGD